MAETAPDEATLSRSRRSTTSCSKCGSKLTEEQNRKLAMNELQQVRATVVGLMMSASPLKETSKGKLLEISSELGEIMKWEMFG